MPDALERRLDALLALGRLHAAIGERQLDVLEDRQVANQVEALEDEPDLAVAHARPLGRRRARRPAGCSAGSCPSVGESSRPRIESSVDLPQPDGPAIDDVFAFVDLEVDPGQGMRLDFVGEEDLGHTIQLDQRLSVLSHASRAPCRASLLRLAVRRPEGRRPVISTECDRRRRMPTCRTESPDRRPSRPDSTSMVLTELRPSFTCTRSAFTPSAPILNRPTTLWSWPNAGRPMKSTSFSRSSSIVPSHAQVGHRALRQIAGERDVDRARAVLHRRIDAGDAPCDDAVARVDFGLLAELDVLGLRLGDLDFRLQAARVRDAREVRARRDLLADFDRHQLQHAVEAGADLELVALLLRQLEQRVRLIDQRLLHVKLRAHRIGLAGELILRDLVAHAQRLARPPATAPAPASRRADPSRAPRSSATCIFALL